MATDIPCTHVWVLTETGYVRTWQTVIDEQSKTITGCWGGSEDFSESGAGDEHLACSLLPGDQTGSRRLDT